MDINTVIQQSETSYASSDNKSDKNSYQTEVQLEKRLIDILSS